MQIRLFQPGDTAQIAQLFYNTVRKVNIHDYSAEQVMAWSPDDLYFRDWLAICSSRFTYVAAENEKILGFGELELDGHIDCFYIHDQHQRQGIGSKIYQTIEIKAIQLGLTRLFTEASITANSFFISQGFKIIHPQEVSCRGQILVNYLMEKTIQAE
jgi:GNAT superfamily N-acetyltransferase